MTVATINLNDYTVTFHDTSDRGVAHAEKHDHLFVGAPSDLAELTGSQMVALYNATAAVLNTGISPVSRFATKEAGIKRIMANITDLWEVHRLKQKAKVEKPVKTKVKTSTSLRRTGTNLAPKDKVYPCRAGTKQAILVDMLSRPEGATMSELLTALSGGSKPWQEVTVKSGLNWDMNNVKGYGIRTTQRDGVDCYHLVLPEGMTSPLPHTPRKG